MRSKVEGVLLANGIFSFLASSAEQMEVRDYANAENEVFIIDNGEIIWFYRSDSMYSPLSCCL